LLSDVASFLVAIVAIYLAEKFPTKRKSKKGNMKEGVPCFMFGSLMKIKLYYMLGHSFGFYRAEVIAALISVFTIWILTGFLVMKAFHRLKHPAQIDAQIVSLPLSSVRKRGLK
jgi:Co/Zn/Cd efflux system component